MDAVHTRTVAARRLLRSYHQRPQPLDGVVVLLKLRTSIHPLCEAFLTAHVSAGMVNIWADEIFVAPELRGPPNSGDVDPSFVDSNY